MERVDNVLQRDVMAMRGYVELISVRVALLERREALENLLREYSLTDQARGMCERKQDRLDDDLEVLDEIEARLSHILGFDGGEGKVLIDQAEYDNLTMQSKEDTRGQT